MKSFVVRLANLIGETGIYQLVCPNRLPVFMLHRVTDGQTELAGAMPADTLRSYLSYLSRRRYRVLTMAELLAILENNQNIPRKSVMFTIDDGFYDHHDLAGKIFDEYGFPLNFFVITDLLDSKLWPWDDQINYAIYHTELKSAEIVLPSGNTHHISFEKVAVRQSARELRNLLKQEDQMHIYDWLARELYPQLNVPYPSSIPPEYQPMSWDNARSLRARGHGVYPHTCSHRIMSTLSLDEKKLEINQSFKRVENELDFTPDVFAYPTGRSTDYDEDDIDELRKSGFKMAFNTVPDYVRKGQNQFELSRFSLPVKPSEFLQIINRFEALNRRIHRQQQMPVILLPTH